MNLVIDCSFIMSTILPEEQNKHLELSCYRIYVPSIFFLECNNVLISAVKRKRINESQCNDYINILSQLPVMIDKFASLSESVFFISRLAKKHNLSAYDASYLELAIRYKAGMATYDRNLQAACLYNEVRLI